MKQSSNLIFFGSGPVASATLSALYDAGFNFEIVVTKPRVDGFRGDVPVIALANSLSIDAITPTNKLELTQSLSDRDISSQLGLVVDYGLIISKAVINRFPMGILNSHFSLLPEWRGADPITFSILSGQTETGVSLMLIDEKLDEGPLVDQRVISIDSQANIRSLTDQLVALSNKLLIEDLPKYLNGNLKIYPQPSKPPSYSRKLVKEDGAIDWRKPAIALEREIRAYIGWPKSYGVVMGKNVIITKGRVAANSFDGKLVIECGQNSWLEILELIAPSGRTMSGEAFLRGYVK